MNQYWLSQIFLTKDNNFDESLFSLRTRTPITFDFIIIIITIDNWYTNDKE